MRYETNENGEVIIHRKCCVCGEWDGHIDGCPEYYEFDPPECDMSDDSPNPLPPYQC